MHKLSLSKHSLLKFEKQIYALALIYNPHFKPALFWIWILNLSLYLAMGFTFLSENNLALQTVII